MFRIIMFVVAAVAALALPSPVLMAGSTFRAAALEYSGHTRQRDSERKMEILYEGVRTAIEAQAKAGTPVDLLVLSETPTTKGSEDGFENMAQEIPGPRTERLAELARTYKTWIVISLLERQMVDGKPAYYNTAVIFDRRGRIVARYRKVNLPPEESTRDILPGSDIVVIDTEFGPLAPVVCWDANFPEFLAKVAAKKPHIVVQPTAGDYRKQLTAAAEKYGWYVISSVWDGPSVIIDAKGKILDEQQYDGFQPAEMKLVVADLPVASARPAATQPAATQPASASR